MITTPLIRKPVNWVDGMKLNSDHFIQTDYVIQHGLQDIAKNLLNQNNYGLIVSFPPAAESLVYDLIEKPGKLIEMELHQLNAITMGGHRLQIDRTQGCAKVHLTHYVEGTSAKQHDGNYLILLTLNPDERIPSGTPDPEEIPLRFPEINRGYRLSVWSESAFEKDDVRYCSLVIEKFSVDEGHIRINKNYVPPCHSVSAHPKLISFHGQSIRWFNDLEKNAIKIIEKSWEKDASGDLPTSFRTISLQILNNLSQYAYFVRNEALNQPPSALINCFSTLAGNIYSNLQCLSNADREEAFKYLLEWKNIQPEAFNKILLEISNLTYDHNEIARSIKVAEKFITTLNSLWDKLTRLEYIGQHKENMIVAERAVTPTVQNKKTWTIID